MENGETKPVEGETTEVIPEPEAIQEARKIINQLITLLDEGEIEELSVYAATRDGQYRVFQSHNNGRHEDAGRIMELAMIRLGFVQTHQLPEEE